MPEYTDGPDNDPWVVIEVVCIFVQRGGCDAREEASNYVMPWEFFVPLDLEDADKAAYLAARLNDLDTARARIALLEARLNALCGAVREEWEADREWLDDLNGIPMVGTPRLRVAEDALVQAEQAAREVLNDQ